MTSANHDPTDVESGVGCWFLPWICDVSKQLQLFRAGFFRWGQLRSQRNPIRKKFSQDLFGWVVVVLTCLLCHFTSPCTDIGRELLDYPCLDYDPEHSVFEMTCSFSWTNNTKCITLLKIQKFEGNGHAINLTGVYNWEGLFRIAGSSDGGPSSLEDAPFIHDVHMIGGETSASGGFIVQGFQKHFMVRNCSSSGDMLGQSAPNYGGGGICGHGCSGDILITHCWSSGEIGDVRTGGIAGGQFGFAGNEDNIATISHCYSTGDISGLLSGGISGELTGASTSGIVKIEQCYSVGAMRGSGSGGIIASATASSGGHVSVTNCYSRGDVNGWQAGGICGDRSAMLGGTVSLTNVYASGMITDIGARGLIGNIDGGATKISVTMSVYNGATGQMIGNNRDADIKENNSGDLRSITGTVYCYEEEQQEECWNTETVWQAVDDNFPILQGMPTPFPSTSSAPSPSWTSSAMPSPSPTETISSTTTASSMIGETATPSATPTQKPKRMELPIQYPRRSVI